MNHLLTERTIHVAVSIILFVTQFVGADEVLTYSDIVERLYNLERLADLPLPGEKCAAWTSTDRAASYNQQTGRYENWAANADGDGFIHRQGSAIVAAEMKGPGVTWRIWSAEARDGHIKIYIDDANQPALDIPFKDYFDNTTDPFGYAELVHIKARGNNSFVPICYQKSCRILLEEGWGRYYQITYSTFSQGTRVPSFRGSFIEKDKSALIKANETLARRGNDPKPPHIDEHSIGQTINIPPGEKVKLIELNGPRAITAIRVLLDKYDDQDIADILRELALTIKWDGESTPAVWAPLGDFFGTSPGYNSYRSLPMGMTDSGFYSFWFMPFSKGCLIELTNDGKSARTLRFTVSHRPLTNGSEKLLRFHAKWHGDAFLIQNKDRWPDWPLLFTKVHGRFCGLALHVWNPRWIKHGFEGAKPGDYWWGEGDEKFFVDGERYPSTFGTGTEDYFGFAWATPVKYDSAFQCQILNQNNSNGHISLARFQIADNVPFQRSFEAVLEKYYPNQWNGSYTLYDTVVYWYQAAGTDDPYVPVPIEKRMDCYPNP